MRKRELLRLKWADLDIDQRVLRVAHTKNHKVRYLPMNRSLVELLGAIPPFVGPKGQSPYVFTNPETGGRYTLLCRGSTKYVNVKYLISASTHQRRRTLHLRGLRDRQFIRNQVFRSELAIRVRSNPTVVRSTHGGGSPGDRRLDRGHRVLQELSDYRRNPLTSGFAERLLNTRRESVSMRPSCKELDSAMGMNKNKLNVWLLVLLGAGLATGGAVLLAPARTNSESEDPTELVPESKLKPRRGASGARGESGVQGLDLLDLVRTPEDAVAGVWGFQNAALISSNIRRSRLQIPCLLPEEYDLKAVVTRKAGTNAFSLGFVLKGKQGLIVLDGLDGHTSWLFLATAPDHESNPTRTTGKALRWNKPAEILLSVRKGRVRMTVDGKVRLDWTADPGELFMPSEFAVPDQRLLTVGSWESNYRIDELRLIPVTGSAQPLR